MICASRESEDPQCRPVLEIFSGGDAPAPADSAAAASTETVGRTLKHPADNARLAASSAAPTTPNLVVNGSSKPKEAFLAFDLPGLNCDVTGAKLRLYHNGGGASGGKVFLVACAGIRGERHRNLPRHTRA
ncbi:MAG: hypothetical protein ACM3ZC_00490 [Bacteroidota bacterium]